MGEDDEPFEYWELRDANAVTRGLRAGCLLIMGLIGLVAVAIWVMGGGLG